MPAFRYVALAALVVWLGLTMVALGQALGRDLLDRFAPVAAAAGAVVFVALFVMKFVGPPPRAFPIRAAIVFAMLAATVYPSMMPAHAIPALGLTTALGFVLLFWYSRE